MFEGTNHLPVRALSESLGLEVAGDSINTTVVLTTPGKAETTSVGEGMYLVGKDIPAGTYFLTATSREYSGYYERAKDASGQLDFILSNSNFATTAYVAAQDGEYLKLTRCTGILQ